MRYTIVKGIDDGLKIDLGGSVSIISAVMEIGRSKDYLTYEAEMTGAELLEFLGKFSVGIARDISERVHKKLTEGIVKENRYTITAYDW